MRPSVGKCAPHENTTDKSCHQSHYHDSSSQCRDIYQNLFGYYYYDYIYINFFALIRRTGRPKVNHCAAIFLVLMVQRGEDQRVIGQTPTHCPFADDKR